MKSFRNLLQNSSSDHRALTAQAAKLYDLLIRPAEAKVAGAQRILLSPNGPLYTLPFAALVGKGSSSPRGSRSTQSFRRPSTPSCGRRAARRAIRPTSPSSPSETPAIRSTARTSIPRPFRKPGRSPSSSTSTPSSSPSRPATRPWARKWERRPRRPHPRLPDRRRASVVASLWSVGDASTAS